MSINSYAQNFEDVMLWRAVGHVRNGFYIDIGAQDPLIDSVSLAFHERGWKGIHVEPTPYYAELLRKQRPGDTVIQAAVGRGRSKLKFYEIPKTGISTADPAIAEQHRERGFEVREISVSAMPLSAIFKYCNTADIHWLKIDVEGLEKQVLRSWGSSPIRPWIVVVESTLPLTQIEAFEDWEPILLSYGYTVAYFDGLNRYYISNSHEELRAAFNSPPNVFDAFTLNGTASATFHRLIDGRHKEEIRQLASQHELQLQKKARESELRILQLQQDASQRERALSSLSQQTLDKARRESQLHLKEIIERERTFNTLIIRAQDEAKVAREEYAARERALEGELSVLRETIEHAKDAAHAREIEHTLLREEVKRDNEVKLHLRQMLAAEQRKLSETHATISWRMTSPLRMLSEMISPSKREPEIRFDSVPSSTSLALSVQAGIANAVDKGASPQVHYTPDEVPMRPSNPPTAFSGTTVDELLALEGESFVCAVYQTLFGREPDPEGLSYYLGRLKAGYSKLRILTQCRLSKEGMTRTPCLIGLDAAIRRQKRAEYPLIGWLFGLVEGTESNRTAARRLRAIDYQTNYRAMQREEIHATKQLDPEALSNYPTKTMEIYGQLVAATNRRIAKGT